MSVFSKKHSGKKKYLLIPAMPTPNGRLHLGHMSGPFLKMDILARSLRLHGHTAEIISASDVYESYVLLKSHQTNLPVEEVCNSFHEMILRDLSAMMIDCMYYFNPLAETFHDKVNGFYTDTIDKLEKSGSVVTRTEKIMYCPSAGKYIVGAWLKGNCPHCHYPAGSYLCERCGMQFNPEDVVNTVATTGENELQQVEVSSLFLKIKEKDKLLEHIQTMGVPEHFVLIVNKYLDRYRGEVRLTNPGNWGVKWGDGSLLAENYNVIFPYTGLFSLSRMCGELFRQKNNLDKNPFDRGSEVITIASFGIDSTIPWFVGVLGTCLSSDNFKPFDYFLTNHFYNLEGAKFSTSRMHVIWADDIINKTKASSDAVRYYLTKYNPEFEEKNFFIDDFIEVNNNYLAAHLDTLIQSCWNSLDLDAIAPIDDSLENKLESAVARQTNFLQPPNQQMEMGLSVIEEWIKELDCDDVIANQPYWALKSIALLSYPVMPLLGETLWRELGNEKLPQFAGFFDLKLPAEKGRLSLFFEVITYEDLIPCLPSTITKKKLYVSEDV